MELYKEDGTTFLSSEHEVIEQSITKEIIHPSDKVLELGARYGSVSILTNQILANKTLHVVVEPDDTVWEALEKNREKYNCKFQIVKGFLSEKQYTLQRDGYASHQVEGHSVIPSTSLHSIDIQFNALIADCEGGLKSFFEDYPFMYDRLDKIFMEEDGNIDYKPIKVCLSRKGFIKVIEYGDYNGLVHSVWVRVANYPVNYIISNFVHKQIKIYVMHCDELIDRRKRLESEFKRLGLTNVEWITSFPKDDPIIEECRVKTGTKISKEYISLSLKHYEACRRMCEENIEEAIVFEDDVIFSSYFDISKIPRDTPYVKLGKCTPDMNIEFSHDKMTILNNGGTEAYYMRIEFAKNFIENINLMNTIDIEQHGYLIYNDIPLICVPMCTQDFSMTTIPIEKRDFGIEWKDYIYKWDKCKKFKFLGTTIVPKESSINANEFYAEDLLFRSFYT